MGNRLKSNRRDRSTQDASSRRPNRKKKRMCQRQDQGIQVDPPVVEETFDQEERLNTEPKDNGRTQSELAPTIETEIETVSTSDHTTNLEVLQREGSSRLPEEQEDHVYHYITSNYIAPETSLQHEKWYFGDIERSDAEELLMQSGIRNGTFMVRKSSNEGGAFTLSLREEQKVKHYRIRCPYDGTYCISDRCFFQSLKDLVSHYQQLADGLNQCITVACPKRSLCTVELNHTDGWEIKRSNLKFNVRIGGGNFGEVFSGVLNDSTPVAIKKIKEGSMMMEDFVKEAQLMKSIHHPNLLQLLGVCTITEPIFIVTELMQPGSLLEYLRNGEGQHIQITEMVNIIIQIAKGMAYLEKEKYIHRDLAARNVLVGKDKIIKVADFGLARFIIDEYYKAREGTKFPFKWTAPEAILLNRFSIKSDVWSFGITMHEVLSRGERPYPGIANEDLIEKIKCGYRMAKPDICPKALYEIMQMCLMYESQERPSFEELVAAMQLNPQ